MADEVTFPVIAALLLLAVSSSYAAQTALPPDRTVIRTESGLVRGVRAADVMQWKGIPYAASPAGDGRWASPRPALAWTGVRDASRYGSGCPQVSRYGLTEAGYDEDCLSINITIPAAAAAARRPVIAWLYGGAFVGGSSALYPLSHMALAGNAVVVSFNYRLGVFGFMANSAFSRDMDGGYGLEDQRAALRWVQRNISAFGGDPARVTVAGESAGAASICMHLVSPGVSTGLFAGAVVQSAACAQRLRTREAADKVGNAVSRLAGCEAGAGALACLRRKPVRDLLEAAAKVAGSDVMTYVPSFGGMALKEQPRDALAAGRFVRVPIINGGNRDELRLYVAYDAQAGRKVTAANYGDKLRAAYGDKTDLVLAEYPAVDYSSPSAALGTAMSDFTPHNGLNNCGYLETARLTSRYVRVYEYEFADRNAPAVTPDPGFEMGAVHSSELPYQFPGFSNTTALDGAGVPAQSRPVADAMMAYWTRFAAAGMPGGAGLPTWTPYPATVMRLDPSRIGSFDAAAEHHCAFWQRLYPGYLTH